MGCDRWVELVSPHEPDRLTSSQHSQPCQPTERATHPGIQSATRYPHGNYDGWKRLIPLLAILARPFADPGWGDRDSGLAD